ncbi:MAG: DUF2254 domain-containing protein [Dehalococcoidia bacterium]
MRTRLSNAWYSAHSSFWFVPSVMTAAAIGLAVVLLALDEAAGIRSMVGFGTLQPDGARDILSTIAGSMITVAGVVFSITIVSLTLASSQFGSRILRTFMRDTGNQVVLGMFLATFVYCLLILGAIRAETDDELFVPYISVAFGIILALASLGVLIYFIHHVSASIQANSIVASVGQDLEGAINRLFPERLGRGPDDVRHPDQSQFDPAEFERVARAVPSNSNGYLRTLNNEALMHLAKSNDLVIRIEYRPGDFIVHGNTVALASPGAKVDSNLMEKINGVFILGRERTLEQDVAFVFNQLVEMAERALSPGINDAQTAMTCIDRIGAGLAQLADRQTPSSYRYDDEGVLRVIVMAENFEDIAQKMLDRLRRSSQANATVMIHLLEMIRGVAPHIRRSEGRSILVRQARVIHATSNDQLGQEYDREAVSEAYDMTLAALIGHESSSTGDAERTISPGAAGQRK